ncbi:hypothetical protein N7517_000992 [Penicillium concentricum]|uniref:Protein kinase domain-containing protein n=1 Tax=Penicillium concentricum TaxID=293559 RepID=A0A9W9VKQ0_9EURO|nr:uncharacterized protein N7517_000992 [Penicillium concentricum]KAJ5383081.1 hypothetical protein N7517_000992 [Penicillium concentricum]
MHTRVHTVGHRQLDVRYVKLDQIGSGQFGVVYKAFDVDTGSFIAVKKTPRPNQDAGDERSYETLKREVEALSRLGHRYIIEFIASQGGNELSLDILMRLADGTLHSLVATGEFSSHHSDLTNKFAHHTLQALDYLDIKGVVHRDTKPENILYTRMSLPPHMLYQVGEFGLCNRTVSARTHVGTPLFAAPELPKRQSHKMDVWSLFVTIAWTVDLNNFRQNSHQFSNVQEVHKQLSDVAPKMTNFSEMARLDLSKRASAAHMLVKCFNGVGLSTPRNQVPPLSSSKLEITDAELHWDPMELDDPEPLVNDRAGPGIKWAPNDPTNPTPVRKSRRLQAQALKKDAMAAKSRFNPLYA